MAPSCMFVLAAPTCMASTEMIVKEIILGSPMVAIQTLVQRLHVTGGALLRDDGSAGVVSAWVAGKMCRPIMAA
ncbi:hypothetical protein EDD18DRAFT_1124502 [Armillaria luteobubalina]|uniref:Uncharacterized protein n=1 Tax=Armillaria luteobubalina TaxID=153913 RepID=A0AA39U2Y3_9AGAR|nr:hypothetical protein EDD18DRAFT_1124502 [Armillaria luteobubalina]